MHEFRSMNKQLKLLLTGFLLFSAGVVMPKIIHAQTFPVRELGNCRDSAECHLYCEIPEHKPGCWSYGVYRRQSDVLGEETPETKLEQLGITFPIAELGNCANLTACKSYCATPQNKAACTTYAQNHGLAKGERILAKAKAELGCSTKDECVAFCQVESNRAACSAFAKKYHLRLYIKNQLVEAATSELGCTTIEACRTLCAEPSNQAKCQALAEKLGLGVQARREALVEKAKQELGCTSFAQCKTFCQEETNRDKCRNFGQAIKEQVKSKLQERFDCETNEECRKQCQEHPDNCPGFPNLLPGASPLLKKNNLIVPPPRYKDATPSNILPENLNSKEIMRTDKTSQTQQVEESSQSTMGL